MSKAFLILSLSAMVFPIFVLAAGNGQACAPCGRPGDAACSVGACSSMWGGNYCIPANAVCFPNPLETTTLGELFEKISNIFFALNLAISPLFIIYAGFLMIWGGNSPEALQKARNIFKWTLIGGVVAFLAKAIIFTIKGIIK